MSLWLEGDREYWTGYGQALRDTIEEMAEMIVGIEKRLARGPGRKKEKTK